MKLAILAGIFIMIWGVFLFTTVSIEVAGPLNTVALNYLENCYEDTGSINVVAAILADYRLYDTVGEATVLFVAILGVTLILGRNHHRTEQKIRQLDELYGGSTRGDVYHRLDYYLVFGALDADIWGVHHIDWTPQSRRRISGRCCIGCSFSAIFYCLWGEGGTIFRKYSVTCRRCERITVGSCWPFGVFAWKSILFQFPGYPRFWYFQCWDNTIDQHLDWHKGGCGICGPFLHVFQIHGEGIMSWVNGITIGVVLLLIGFFGCSARKNLIKIIMCIDIVFLGLILFFVSLGYVEGGTAPILGEYTLYVDPLPQTLMLTTVVVGLSTTALALALAIKVYEQYKTLNVEELE
jgi:multicomponent Na+:H+ antiporter subunit C